MAHRTRAGGDKHGRAFLEIRQHDGLVAGIGGNAETSPGLRTDVRWQRHRLLRRQHDPFGGGAEGAPPLSVPNPDPFAQARRRYLGADAVDLAGAVAVWNHARKRDLARYAGTALHVGRIDAGGDEAHPDLTGSRLWSRDLGDPQNVAGGSVGLVVGSAHGMIPLA